MVDDSLVNNRCCRVQDHRGVSPHMGLGKVGMVDRVADTQACSPPRRRTASRRVGRFGLSDTCLELGSSRTMPGLGCRCRVDDEASADVRTCRCACILRGNSYRLRAEIDTRGMRNRTGRRKRERERERTRGTRKRVHLNVIVMEKLFNLPLMFSHGTCAKLIAYKKFIVFSWGEKIC